MIILTMEIKIKLFYSSSQHRCEAFTVEDRVSFSDINLCLQK